MLPTYNLKEGNIVTRVNYDCASVLTSRISASGKELNLWWKESVTGTVATTPVSLKSDRDCDSIHLPHEARQSNWGIPDFYYNMLNKYIVDSHYTDNASLSHCEDLKHLGQGSHSKVMTCKYNKRQVVVKIISEAFTHDPMAQQEFQGEIAILVRISHPHIVKLHASGFEYYRPIIVLEHLEGGTLKTHLNIRRSEYKHPFLETRYLRMARELADALDFFT